MKNQFYIFNKPLALILENLYERERERQRDRDVVLKILILI